MFCKYRAPLKECCNDKCSGFVNFRCPFNDSLEAATICLHYMPPLKWAVYAVFNEAVLKRDMFNHGFTVDRSDHIFVRISDQYDTEKEAKSRMDGLINCVVRQDG